MTETSRSTRAVRFGSFETDLEARELRRKGLKLRLQEKPFRILELLLERAGEVVTREELHRKLWPDTHVGFDRGLNTAINALRYALSDSAANPRFVETCQRRGYRFIAPVEWLGATRPGKSDAIDSIAVLPLSNEARDPDMDYLSDGITECIINTLSRLPDVRVMARATVFHYKGREVTPQTVGRELNVRAVLMGRVLQRGETLGISIEAIDTLDGCQLWGEQFHRKVNDLFALQEEISSDVCEKLRPRLSREQRNLLIRKHTEDAEAYRDNLKGRYFLNQMTGDSLLRSVTHFKQAIQRDAQFAPAYAGLAACYGLFGFFSFQPPREVMPAAKEAALRALEIDGGLAEAHASLAGILKSYDWDWDAAEQEYVRALELSPNYATGHHYYADFLSAMGRPQEAIREIRIAQELDPLSLVISNEVGWNLYMARQHDGAIEHSLKTLDMEPRFPAAYHTLGLAYEQLGRFEDAIAALDQARVSSGDNPASLSALGHAYSMAGRLEDAVELLDRLRALSRTSYVSAYQSAILYTGLGMRDMAIDSLRKAVEERDVWLVWLKREPRLDSLRSDSRLSEILRDMKLDS